MYYEIKLGSKMKKQNYISRRSFLRRLGVLFVSIPFMLSAFSCKNQENLSESGSFDQYLKNLPSITLDNASGMEGSSEVFKVAKTAVIEGLNNQGVVTKIIYTNDTINLESIIVKVLNSEDEYYYITEDTTANQPTGRLANGTVLLNDVKNSIKALRDFNKAELKSRYIVIQK